MYILNCQNFHDSPSLLGISLTLLKKSCSAIVIVGVGYTELLAMVCCSYQVSTAIRSSYPCSDHCTDRQTDTYRTLILSKMCTYFSGVQKFSILLFSLLYWVLCLIIGEKNQLLQSPSHYTFTLHSHKWCLILLLSESRPVHRTSSAVISLIFFSGPETLVCG
jgi:hypothetical protein